MNVHPLLRIQMQAPLVLLYVCQSCGVRSTQYGSRRVMNLDGSYRSEIACAGCQR